MIAGRVRKSVNHSSPLVSLSKGSEIVSMGHLLPGLQMSEAGGIVLIQGHLKEIMKQIKLHFIIVPSPPPKKLAY